MESESYSNNNNSEICDSSIDNEEALNGHEQNTEDLAFESKVLVKQFMYIDI
jgi:hypothetical protein